MNYARATFSIFSDTTPQVCVHGVRGGRSDAMPRCVCIIVLSSVMKLAQKMVSGSNRLGSLAISAPELLLAAIDAMVSNLDCRE